MIKDAVDILNERIYALLDENTILKEREDGLNHALKLAEAEIDRLLEALERIEQYKQPDQLIEELDYQNRLLLDENKRLREALNDLYSMASSPQWRNEPLYRICELLEQALESK